MRALLVLAVLTAGCDRAETEPAAPLVARDHFATTPDSVGLYYRVVGDAGPVILAPFALFHGSALDSLAAAGFRVVTYDPRGRGRSAAVRPDQVALDKLLLDLETVRQAVGAEQVSIIGWSGGGMETFVYALRNPERVTRLVQLAPVAPRFAPWGDSLFADRAARTDTAAAAALAAREASGDFAADSAAHCRADQAVSRPPTLGNPSTASATPDVCEFANEWPGRLGPYFGALFRSIVDLDFRDSLPRVTIPRLVIHGERDNTPLAGNLEWIAGAPTARLLVIRGAGHWPHYEARDETLAAIRTFLAGSWPEGTIAR